MCESTQLLQQLLALRLDLLGEVRTSLLVRLALEYTRDFPPTPSDQLVEITRQFRSSSSRQADGDWLLGLVEVVDVAPI